MKRYTTARKVEPDNKDLRRMIKLIRSQKAKQKKTLKKFIEKVREALYELEREL